MRIFITTKATKDGTDYVGDIEMTPDEERRFAMYLMLGSIQGRPVMTTGDAIGKAKELVDKVLPRVEEF